MELAVTDCKIQVIWVITVCQWGYRHQQFEDHSPFIFRVKLFPPCSVGDLFRCPVMFLNNYKMLMLSGISFAV